MSGPRISIIAAMAENRVIGRSGTIPWDLPEDRRRFRELTWGHPVIMGRKTFESIGRPLPGRITIVLSRQEGYAPAGCLVAHDLASAVRAAGAADELFICGGERLYREALPLATRLYLTIVHVEAEGDVRFPEIPAGEFVATERREVPAALACTFMVCERRMREDSGGGGVRPVLAFA